MNIFNRLFPKRMTKLSKLDIGCIIENRLFDEDQVNKFEAIWIRLNKHKEYGVDKSLSDEDYIDYHIWEDINWRKMYNEYLPKTSVHRCINPNIIFHGGCLGCLSQIKHSIERCKGCTYFGANSSRENLFIPGGKSSTMTLEDFDNFLHGI